MPQVDEAGEQGDGGAAARLREEGGGAALRHDQPQERHRLPQGPGTQFNTVCLKYIKKVPRDDAESQILSGHLDVGNTFS